jgi:hypothetical protein
MVLLAALAKRCTLRKMRYVMALAVVLGACDAAEPDPIEAEFESTLRLGGFPNPANYPGNGDLAVYEGASTASEDCLIYTTVGTQVYAGRAPAAPLVMNLSGNSILDANGTLQCSLSTGLLTSRLREGGPGGPVLFTNIGPWIFSGNIDTNQSVLAVVQQMANQLEYTFFGASIYEHTQFDGAILATATTAISNAEAKRKLTLAAAISAECGGLGLYADEAEEDH